MTRLMLLTESAVSTLRSQLEKPGGLAGYRGGGFTFTRDALLPSTVEVSDTLPELKSAGPECDAPSSVNLYRWLGRLEEVLATDERLWAALAHGHFAAYTRSRWPVPSDDSKAISSICSHWFVGGGLGGLRRNSVARLWWAAHLTYAPWEDELDGAEFGGLKPPDGDHFVYTRTLFKNQNVYQALVEREFGSSRRVLIAMLEVIRCDPKNRATDAFSNGLGKQVNLLSAFREIASLSVATLIKTFETLAARFSANQR